MNKLSFENGDTKKWTSSNICRILSNPKYCGDLVQGLSYTEDFLSKNRKLQTDSEKLYYLKDHHEAIISRDIFEKVQNEKDRRASLKKRRARTSYSKTSVFSNKIECYHCHKCYVRKTAVRNGKRYTVWKCSRKDKEGKVACSKSKNINEDVFYSIVEKTYDYLHVNIDVVIEKLMTVLQTVMNSDSDSSKIEEYQNELNQLKIQFDKLIDLNLQGYIPHELFEKKYNDLTYKMNDIENKLNQTKGTNQSKETYEEKFFHLSEIVKMKVENWKQLEDEIISKILDHIEVIDKEEFNIFLKIESKIVHFAYNSAHFQPQYTSVE